MKTNEACGTHDSRWLPSGLRIPTVSYSDQPFVLQADDGAWLCCVTTGPGHEGEGGQHVATLRSVDQGRTWSAMQRVEPVDSPEHSYAVMLKVPSGRIYIFYNHNTDNVRKVLTHDRRHAFTRVDSLGYYVFKYSDDHGRTWSARRYPIPVREFACDRENVYGGRIRFFWNVGKPFVHAGSAYVSLHKVGRMGEGFFAQSEGVLLRSGNILTVKDPNKITWETLPEGGVGLRAPRDGGPIAEEQSYVVLSDGSFYCTYRTVAGFAAEAYSRDGGRTWSEPVWRCFADGRPMKHPRAATFVWRCANGRYLCWFHNHGGRFIGERRDRLGAGYENRNPVWMCGGVEVDGPRGRELRWSQPEIVLYDDDPLIRISYPDLIEAAGVYFVTETQKQTARLHRLDEALLEGMWRSAAGGAGARLAGGRPRKAPGRGEWTIPLRPGDTPAFIRRAAAMPYGAERQRGAGVTLALRLRLPVLKAACVLVDTRTGSGSGLAVVALPTGRLEVVLADGQTENHWVSEPVLRWRREQRVVVVLDNGPGLVLFVVDGRFCDGADHQQFGWGRYSPRLMGITGRPQARIAGGVREIRWFSRALRIFEAVSEKMLMN